MQNPLHANPTQTTIALSPTLHRAFDRGLIAISDTVILTKTMPRMR